MEKLCIFFVFAIITNEAMSMTFRHKRQSNDEGENSLDDRYGWDRPRQRPWQQQNQWTEDNDQQRPFPNQRPNQPQQQWPIPDQGGQQPQTPRPNGSTTQSPAVASCIRSCPTTSEYNPVCGSDNVTYSNPGRLSCAQLCGLNVNLLRSSPCPTTTTAAPPS